MNGPALMPPTTEPAVLPVMFARGDTTGRLPPETWMTKLVAGAGHAPVVVTENAESWVDEAVERERADLGGGGRRGCHEGNPGDERRRKSGHGGAGEETLHGDVSHFLRWGGVRT